MRGAPRGRTRRARPCALLADRRPRTPAGGPEAWAAPFQSAQALLQAFGAYRALRLPDLPRLQAPAPARCMRLPRVRTEARSGLVVWGGAGRGGRGNGGAQYLKRQAVRQWQRLPERQRATQTGRLAVDRIDGAELTRLLAAIRRRPPVAVRLGAVFDGNKVLL